MCLNIIVGRVQYQACCRLGVESPAWLHTVTNSANSTMHNVAIAQCKQSQSVSYCHHALCMVTQDRSKLHDTACLALLLKIAYSLQCCVGLTGVRLGSGQQADSLRCATRQTPGLLCGGPHRAALCHLSRRLGLHAQGSDHSPHQVSEASSSSGCA